MLSPDEIKRYQRHFVLPNFGQHAQEKLKNSSVLIVGLGALGSPVSLYLAAAGIGRLGLVDADSINITNLQRQVLYREHDINSKKLDRAIANIAQLNHNVKLDAHPHFLSSENALEIIAGYDLVVDCTDNFPTRYLVNDACLLLDKPYVYGSIHQYEGQVSVFNANSDINYRDLFPEPPNPESVPNCEEGGVLGSLAGIIGSIQANEAIKLLTNIGEPLIEKLFIFDSLTLDTRKIKLKSKNTKESVKSLIDYDEFCKIKNKMIKEVTVKELHQMMENKEDFQLIDVREPHEAEISTLNGELIPLGQIPDNEAKIETSKKVVIHCRSGARSGQAVNYLQGKLGLDNLYNLKGGILAWADEIDPSMEKY